MAYNFHFIRRYSAGFLTAICIFITQFAFAQSDQDARQEKYAKYRASKELPVFNPQKPYYLLNWNGQRPESIRVYRQLDDSSAIVLIQSQEEMENLQKTGLIQTANDQWKLSPDLQLQIKKVNREQEYILTATNLEELMAVLKTIPAVRILSQNKPSSSVVISTTPAVFLEKILPLKQLIFADTKPVAKPEIAIIGYNRSFHGLSAVDYSIPGANGKNIVVGVKEQRMQEADLDLYKRILPSSLAAGNITPHATIVSTIIGGAGNSFYDGRGIAWGCRFFSSSFDNLFADDPAVLQSAGVSVQNHSYGTVIQSFYGAEAISYDAQTWSNKNFVHVFSAGNQGIAAATTGPYAGLTGYANITGNFKAAKNVITVGAIDNKNIIAPESSCGPLFDGRIAPQLIALGPNGTSDAAALVSGTVAVLQQVYADSNSNNLPASSLVKAVLFNSADDIHLPGIDHKTGYGLLNSLEAIRTIREKRVDGATLSQGQQWTKTIPIPAGISQLKLTLSWTDSAAQVNTSRALINDLDLSLVEPGTGNIYYPWVLSKAANTDSLKRQSIRGRDSIHTTEQLSVDLPVTGNWLIRVNGTKVINGTLPFHIAFSADTLQTFQFTSPQHTSDVNREENPLLDIRWRAIVTDTNQTGNLFISYNSGTSWQLIKAGQKLFTDYYPWIIRDTSSRALLKMETGFGDFFSREFMIHPVLRPQIDFLCADSLGLSWKKHLAAVGYSIYALSDSAYLKRLYTTTDTFTIIRSTQYPQRVFAVEPILSTGIPASRSIAFDVGLQGVQCFYRTFYYNMQDGNVLDLVLELSAPAYTDSIYFEWIGAGGQLIRVIGTEKTGSFFEYHYQVKDIPQGTSYWRARIRLRNGAMVYTDMISVLSSGQRKILFYPNPASRETSLNWILQQGTPASSRLQLFDMGGRKLADYPELPPTLNLRGFSKGYYMYKLLGSTGNLIEAGKILLQ